MSSDGPSTLPVPLGQRLRGWRARIGGLGRALFSPRLLTRDGDLRLGIQSAHRIRFWPEGEGWKIVAEEPDPQLLLSGLPHAVARYGSAVVRMDVAPDAGSEVVAPELYIDRGAGFTKTDRAAFVLIEGARWEAHLPNLRGVTKLRLDPTEGVGSFALQRLSLRRASTQDAALLVALAPPLRCEPKVGGAQISGARIIAFNGIEPAGDDGVLNLVDDDPQILLDLAPVAATGAAVARITFRVGDEDHLTAPMVYVAYGDLGFDPAASFHLQAQPDGSQQMTIAYPALGAKVRWDPSVQRGRLKLISIEAAPESLANAGAFSETPSAAGPCVHFTPPASADPAELAAWRAEALALTLRLNRDGLNHNAAVGYDYTRWLGAFDEPEGDLFAIKRMISELPLRPKFSFVMPTYNTPPDLLEACINSMLEQVYTDFEICIADDCSPKPEVRAVLKRMAEADPRIKLAFRAENGHISAASNSALELATGDYVVLVDHDDLIPAHCLAVIAAYANRHPNADVFYSDEDKIDLTGARRDPYFKGGFNEYLMFGHNMVSHIGVYRRALLKAIGGFRVGYEGSQDYDLLLRGLDRCGADKIIHIPHVLYHWRMLPGSTAVSADQKSYAITAAQKSLNDHFERRGLPYRSIEGVAPGLSGLGVKAVDKRQMVSLVIPTRDAVDILAACIDSVLQFSDDALEIIVVDNGSVERATLDYLDEMAGQGVLRVVKAPGAFNFSHLCNLGVEAARGEIVCLLNNDTEVLSADWLVRARAHLSVPEVGVVGARLLYPDGALQHCGLYLGLGAHRIAGTPHRGLPGSSFGYFGKARLIQEFSAVTAACLFVRKQDYLAVGGFDEDFAVAYNDVDFCLKVRKAGLKVICDPDISLIHKESRTRGADTDGAKARRLEAEAALMRERWSHVLDNDPYYSPNLTLDGDDMSLAPQPRTPFPWQGAPLTAASGQIDVEIVDVVVERKLAVSL